MKNFAAPLAVTLFLTSSLAWAEADRSTDLRYCLDMKTGAEIAKCAGEISPGEKGKPFSKETAEKIIAREKASTPDGANNSADTPARDQTGSGLSPAKTEGK